MTQLDRLEGFHAHIAENEIDVVLGGAHPNPARGGCPPTDVIEALARRERPADDPEWRHVFSVRRAIARSASFNRRPGSDASGSNAHVDCGRLHRPRLPL
jgi:hypothetical protein